MSSAAGFAQLGAQLNVPAEPARYIEAAAQANVGPSYTDTPLNAAIANLMAAIINSHVLTEPINFFSDPKVHFDLINSSQILASCCLFGVENLTQRARALTLDLD